MLWYICWIAQKYCIWKLLFVWATFLSLELLFCEKMKSLLSFHRRRAQNVSCEIFSTSQPWEMSLELTHMKYLPNQSLTLSILLRKNILMLTFRTLKNLLNITSWLKHWEFTISCKQIWERTRMKSPISEMSPFHIPQISIRSEYSRKAFYMILFSRSAWM